MNDSPSATTKLSWWQRLTGGLKRTSSSLGSAVADLLTKRKLDRAMLDDIEDVLLRADLGTEVASRIAAAGCVRPYHQAITAGEAQQGVSRHSQKGAAPL